MIASWCSHGLWAAVGALLFGAGSFVYFNVDELELMAASASGMPSWSYHQLPYTLPFGFMGAWCATALRWFWGFRK